MFIGINDKLNLTQDIFHSSKILVDHNTGIYDFFHARDDFIYSEVLLYYSLYSDRL